jgi:hypothetical protein
MNYDWTLIQTLIFIITPYFIILTLLDNDEDDDGGDGGIGQLAYNPTQ